LGIGRDRRQRLLDDGTGRLDLHGAEDLIPVGEEEVDLGAVVGAPVVELGVETAVVDGGLNLADHELLEATAADPGVQLPVCRGPKRNQLLVAGGWRSLLNVTP